MFEVLKMMFETSFGDTLFSVYEGCAAPNFLRRVAGIITMPVSSGY